MYFFRKYIYIYIYIYSKKILIVLRRAVLMQCMLVIIFAALSQCIYYIWLCAEIKKRY